MSFNLAAVLRESRRVHPDKPLCHNADQTFSYAQVDEISGRIATSLRNLGVHRGDKVAIQLPNLPHFLFAYFGILKAGAVVVPLNPLLRAPEISHHLRDSDSRLLITFETSADEAVKGAAEIEGLRTYVVNLPGNEQRPVDTKSFDELYLADDTGDIEPTDADLIAALEEGMPAEDAGGKRDDPAELLERLRKADRLDDLRADVAADQALSAIVAAAKPVAAAPEQVASTAA